MGEVGGFGRAHEEGEGPMILIPQSELWNNVFVLLRFLEMKWLPGTVSLVSDCIIAVMNWVMMAN